MEEVKQILVVDDYFQMLEFLRSVLEFSHHEYQVLAVPSAEEGLFELRRTRFDLIITDVRLPGMSGFDLVRKINKLDSEIPIIMITAYSSEQGKREADDLGVRRYFKKPLDPDELLAAVHTLLYGAEEEEESATESAEVSLSLDVRRRLESLRADTGARYVMLSRSGGQILYDGGAGQALDLPVLAVGIAESMQTSFLLAHHLESPEPFTIQYQVGKKYDLYFANVGQDYIVSLFFDAPARRGRLGTIWVFAQRAINDLQALLANQGTGDTAVEPQLDEIAGLEETAELEQPAQEVEPEAVPSVEAEMEAAETAEAVASAAEIVDAETTAEMKVPSLEAIREFLGIDDPDAAEEVDLDSFWDDALEKSEKPPLNSSGMSLEEARKQGLIPTEFDQPRRADTGGSEQ
jgi:DNA-binding response OmpR family regulator